MGEPAVGRELAQAFRQLGGDHRDRRACFEQQGHPPLGHDTAADDEDGAMLQVGEQG